MEFSSWFESKHPSISVRSAQAVLTLTQEGATVPFIARYRKEQTGNLDEVAIRAAIDSKEEWDRILKRQAFIVGEIDHQKKLTPELKERVLSTFDEDVLEDLYLPYKQKRKTKAALAKEAGLQPLADWIWNCARGTETPQPGQTLALWALTFRNEEKGYPDGDASIQGAQDILIERLSENAELRQKVRTALFEQGCLITAKGKKAKPHSKYENYFSFHEKISTLKHAQNSHRYLAARRGWMEEELSLNLGWLPEQPVEEGLIHEFEAEASPQPGSPGEQVLLRAALLAYKAHVFPSIEGEAHKALKEVADEAAVQVFAENLRKILMAPPMGPRAVLGVDPGIRTGCKLAVVDETGKYIASTVIQLQSEGGKEKARSLLGEIIKTGQIRAIAVGNGTAGRETEVFLRSAVKDLGESLPVVMVSEAGASVYSASEVAREEFPELDVTIRGAISIARRLQDPLAELVKVDPKSIGVGQYQHDISSHALKQSLEFVVESCVNSVGVVLNTASPYLLAQVSGIGPQLARSIVAFRSEKGLFRSRDQLLGIPRFSKKAFEQAAGFLRIPDSENPLDNTGVHPERYELLENAALKLGRSVRNLMGEGAQALKNAPEIENEIGTFTFQDIVQELSKPGRDPREEFIPFQFREDILEVKDVKSGMTCPGIVTNVTNFGAFVDIGVHQDGLVHVSQLSDRFVKDPHEVVSPGDRVTVRVLEVNVEKSQLSLSIKAAKEAPKPAAKTPVVPSSKIQANPQPRNSRNGVGGKGPRIIVPAGVAAGPVAGGAGSGGRGIGAGSAQAPRPQQKPRPRPEKPLFNNAFAGLAALKQQLKK